MICKICGKGFNKTSNSQKYCSKECSKICHKEQVKKYNQENKERKEYMKSYLQEYQKEYHKTNKYKEYQKEYSQRLEVKKHRKKKGREYRQTSKYKDYTKKYLQSNNGIANLKRSNNKRKRKLGFNPLNDYFFNSHAHHVNKIDVIYIPKEYHFIGHSVLRNENMEPINTIAFFFLLMQNIDKVRLF